MRWYEPFLYPFSLLYDGITRYRNDMFDTQKKKSTEFLIPTVVVGNLNLGGSGKTPMVEFLIEYLRDKYRLATLSRGYGRKTKGFLLAEPKLGPTDIGDEPFQIYSKFGKDVTVAVGEERVLAIPQIIFHRPKTELILLDDAFQHRYVKADFNILLTTFQNPFFKDKVLPLGTLRENAKGAKRADIIIVTKCPASLSGTEKSFFEAGIRKYSEAPVLFAGIKYGNPEPLFHTGAKTKKKVILVSGIANDSLFKEAAGKKFEVVETITFADHHRYTLADVLRILEMVKNNGEAMVLTTEKDAVKLKDASFHEYLVEIPIFALPIKVDLKESDSQYLIERITKTVKDKAYIREI
ncbi:tetraacyldisaccharide 4'-kinase [Aquiflexum gelatinilyticum]|uniref:tetraacyldisaccharide 4'-kinase n=1 Tax=Aquiflexum gelatinilyticum TaxID=2961943 RepID=UPI0021675041|nr:tetraacyldisaccharide 4'-kinase [Aquiflexum gelatinilyticum]MCS4433556.1 tetraacyldisaccharide 4'-kinase [Aquiflexum gelatinilyticum]